MAMKIFLVGMPGAGKTTLGQQLSKSLQWPFVDLDHEIEARESQTIAEIFTTRGEAVFRQLEKEVLRSLSTGTAHKIIATGGGAPCFHDSMQFMNASGTTIFLDPAMDVLQQRIEQEDQRPLFHNISVREKIENLYAERINFYQQARIRIKEQNPDIQSIITDLRLGSI